MTQRVDIPTNLHRIYVIDSSSLNINDSLYETTIIQIQEPNSLLLFSFYIFLYLLYDFLNIYNKKIKNKININNY